MAHMCTSRMDWFIELLWCFCPFLSLTDLGHFLILFYGKKSTFWKTSPVFHRIEFEMTWWRVTNNRFFIFAWTLFNLPYLCSWAPFYTLAGHLDVVCLLVSQGAEISCKDKRGYTPLHAAASNGQIAVVKHLLSLAVEVPRMQIDTYREGSMESLEKHLVLAEHYIVCFTRR